NGPHRKRLSEKDVRVISGVQPHDHKRLFRSFEASETRQELKGFDDKAKPISSLKGIMMSLSATLIVKPK
ncbi:MAG: hypothetical protein OXC62_10275, partial [Aestuariivita sp.]|nr:hypothetical protein [Aestuariivita sp.]